MAPSAVTSYFSLPGSQIAFNNSSVFASFKSRVILADRSTPAATSTPPPATPTAVPTATQPPATPTRERDRSTRTPEPSRTPRRTATPEHDTCADVTGNGRVTGRDVFAIGSHIIGRYRAQYDLNHDGRVNMQDVRIAIRQLGHRC